MTDHELNLRYLRTFGWTLDEVNAMFAAQGNVCAFCHRPEGKNRLSVDHWHAFDKVKIQTYKDEYGNWHLQTYLKQPKDLPFSHPFAVWITADDKKKGRKLVRQELRRRSVRFGLCLRCNKALALLEDSKAPLSTIDRLKNAVACLENYQKKMLDNSRPGMIGFPNEN